MSIHSIHDLITTRQLIDEYVENIRASKEDKIPHGFLYSKKVQLAVVRRTESKIMERVQIYFDVLKEL